jgi:hypothetical protein
MLYLFELSAIKPNAVFPAFVDDHAGNPSEIHTVHEFSASDTGDIPCFLFQRLTEKLAMKLFFAIHGGGSRCFLKFASVKPDSPACSAKIILVTVMNLYLEGDPAMRADRCEEFDLLMEMSATERTDGIPFIDITTAVLAFLHFALVHSTPFCAFPAIREMAFFLLYCTNYLPFLTIKSTRNNAELL